MSKSLASRVCMLHGFWLKLGPRFGGPFVKMVAYYSLYKIFTSGGVEAVAYVCYEHMLRNGEAERKVKQNGTQTGLRKNERP